MKPEGGFTLIEMLVSVLLLAMLLALASFALRSLLLFTGRQPSPWPGEALSWYQLQTVMHSVVPYALQSRGAVLQGRRTSIYFHGDRNSLLCVTASPLAGGKPAVAQVIFADNRLLLREYALYDPRADYLSPAPGQILRETVIFDGLEKISFRYRLENGEVTPRIDGEIPATILLDCDFAGRPPRRYTFAIRNTSGDMRINMMLESSTDA